MVTVSGNDNLKEVAKSDNFSLLPVVLLVASKCHICSLGFCVMIGHQNPFPRLASFLDDYFTCLEALALSRFWRHPFLPA